MNIEWNKVTWYSKLLAVVVFVLTLALGVYFGMQFQKVRDYNMVNAYKARTDRIRSHRKLHTSETSKDKGKSVPGQF